VKIIGDLENIRNKGLRGLPRLVFCDSITYQSQKEQIMVNRQEFQADGTAKRHQYIQLAIGLFWVCVLALLLLLTGCSTTADKRASEAGWTDTGTTITALALGAAEANPLALAGLIIKPMMLNYAETLPVDEKVDLQSQASAIWGGASANNFCIIGAIVTGMVPLAALCPVVGIAWGLSDWNGSEDERIYAVMCKNWIEAKPGNTCLPFKS
jgi:hypothetical protein